MASEGSKGNKKRSSARQKEHYAAHRHKLLGNKLNRLRRHINRNQKMVEKKTANGRNVAIDQQAIDRYRELKK